MSPHPDQTQAEFDGEEALHYRAVLRRLVDIAMDAATAIGQDTSPKTSGLDQAIRLERIGRTIRRCILLARKLAEPLPARPKPEQDRVAARKRIIREVEDTIDRVAEPADKATLEVEFLDRLDRPELEDDLARRPIADIVAEIARDLGLGTSDTQATQWKRRTPEDIQTLAERAAAPPREPPLRGLAPSARQCGKPDTSAAADPGSTRVMAGHDPPLTG